MTEKINESIKKLVIARIEAHLPSNIKLSIGGSGSMSKEEMIEHVKEADEQGMQIIMMHLNFIKAVTSGELIKELNRDI
jgi:predicted ABC-type ATPase